MRPGLAAAPETVGELLYVVHQPSAGAVLDAVISTGALLEGHFALQGGEHGANFLRFARIGRSERALDVAAEALLEGLPAPAREATVVLSPESAGSFLGATVAAKLGAALAIAQVDDLRCPTARLRSGGLEPGARVLVVNDVVTTGRSLEPLMRCVRERQGVVAGVAAFSVLKPTRWQGLLAQWGLAGHAVTHGLWPTYAPGVETCPACARRIPPLPAAELN